MAVNELNTSVSPSNQTKVLREQKLLNTLPLVRRIAAAKLRDCYQSSIDDLVQIVIMNLWRWQQKRHALPDGTDSLHHNDAAAQTPALSENSELASAADLDQEAWLKIASRAARNEINSFYAAKYHRETLCGDAEELADAASYYGADAAYRLEGESETETSSLMTQIWRELQSLSLRRRYALLLNKDEFIDELVGAGICSITELARFFEMEREEFLAVVEQLPLADDRITALITEKTGATATVKQVWTWRAKAKLKLAVALAGSFQALVILTPVTG